MNIQIAPTFTPKKLVPAKAKAMNATGEEAIENSDSLNNRESYLSLTEPRPKKDPNSLIAEPQNETATFN